MPYFRDWTSNEVAFNINGTNIYHVYKNDDADEGPRVWHFALSDDALEDEAFDVRDLPSSKRIKRAVGQQEWIVAVLTAAIANKEGPFANLPEPAQKPEGKGTFTVAMTCYATVNLSLDVEADSVEEAMEAARQEVERDGGQNFKVDHVLMDCSVEHTVVWALESDADDMDGFAGFYETPLTVPEEDDRVMTADELAQVIENQKHAGTFAISLAEKMNRVIARMQSHETTAQEA